MELYQFILALLIVGFVAKALSLIAMILSIRQRKEKAQMDQIER
jgi:archaellum component FlaG (FlaF/FlaG flagellin family)